MVRGRLFADGGAVVGVLLGLAGDLTRSVQREHGFVLGVVLVVHGLGRVRVAHPVRHWSRRRECLSVVVVAPRTRDDGELGCHVGYVGGGEHDHKVVEGGAGGVAGSTGAGCGRLVEEGGAVSRKSCERNCMVVWGLERVAKRRNLESKDMVSGRAGELLASSVAVRTCRDLGWTLETEAAPGRGLWIRDTCP